MLCQGHRGICIFRIENEIRNRCPRTRSPEKTDQCRGKSKFQECKRRKINALHNIVVRRLRSTNSRKGTPGVNVNRICC
ncbi:unnamed protein product [Tenebrio molitor]|nr:unnamed protein product [Tenebrio molitor]